MQRAGEDGLGRPGFDDLPGIHHGHPVAECGDHAEIMGDQQNGGPELRVQLLQEMKDLSLDGDVEGGRRLVGDDQGGLVAEADGQHDALAHAAGELMGVALKRAFRRGHAHAPEQADGALMGGPAAELAMGPACPRRSAWPIRLTGLSEVIGSWKTMPIALPRSRRSSPRRRWAMSRPRKTIRPATTRPGSSRSPMIERPVMLLPDPDLPDDPDDLSRCDLEAHPIHGPHDPGISEEVAAQPLDLQDRLAGRLGRDPGLRQAGSRSRIWGAPIQGIFCR